MTLLAMPVAGSPLFMAFWYNSTYADEPSVRLYIIAALLAIVVAMAPLKLWLSALARDEPRSGTGDAAWSIGVGALAVFNEVAPGLAFSLSPLGFAGIWLGALARRRGANRLGLLGIILCSTGIVLLLINVARV